MPPPDDRRWPDHIPNPPEEPPPPIGDRVLKWLLILIIGGVLLIELIGGLLLRHRS